MIKKDSIKVPSTFTIKQAIKRMDEGGIGFICVIDENEKVIGVVSDGDFRRAILNEIDLNKKINLIANKLFKFVTLDEQKRGIEKIFKETCVKQIPVLDTMGKLIEVITVDEFYQIKKTKFSKKRLHCEVVIMAGGKGTRLDPFTRILPKPLIPIGDKTIIEIIIEKFTEYQITEFFVSINHKAKIITSYFEEIQPDYKINYIHEEKPLGTVGALKQLEGYSNKEIFLTNCDIIIEADYCDILKHHKEKNNDITIVASLKHYNIPYGICEIENGGTLVNIKEKPEYDFLVNTGMYIISPLLLQYIPKDELFDMTHLIEKIINLDFKVGVYPISERAWIDVGQLSEYKETIKLFS